jgi:hypothetical protein
VLLRNINVARTTETTVTVEFKAEGNDLITIRMSADPAMTDEKAVRAALDMISELEEFNMDA